MSDDLLGRWRLATDIFTVIQETPRDWSCRIGVYGKWGEGKTSLLRFIESQAETEGVISFWVNPSSARSIDDLWRIVVEAFLDALRRSDIRLTGVHSWRFNCLTRIAGPVYQLAELNRYAKAVVSFGREAFREWLLPYAKQLSAIRGSIHANKVIVFVDDLDRTPPALVPAFLLGLRELLDLPNFCFVMAFDDSVVSQALGQVSEAWATGRGFLEKVLDFSFTLPATKPEQRLQLAKSHVLILCPWMDVNVLERNSDVLPHSPRKLKALLRNLMTVAPQMRRHAPQEVQWVDFLFGQLIRLEAPSFLSSFLDVNETLVQVGAHVPTHGQTTFSARLNDAIANAGVSDGLLQARLVELLSAWSERRRWSGGKHLRHFAEVGERHHNITLSEVDRLLTGYHAADIDRLWANLERHAQSVNSPIADVAQEFLSVALDVRGECLANAADTELESDAVDLLEQAKRALVPIEKILLSAAYSPTFPVAFRCAFLRSLVGQFFHWIHFAVPIYQETRQEERRILMALIASDLIGPLDWLGIILPLGDTSLYFTGGREAAAALAGECRAALSDRVISEAIDRFREEGTYRQFVGAQATKPVQFCFLNPDSPIWSEPGRFRFCRALEDPECSRGVRENASELLRCLSWNKARDGFGGNPDELKGLLRLPDVARALWTAATRRRIHYRFQMSLIEVREATLAAGVSADDLRMPEWLAARLSEGSGASQEY